MKISIFQLFCLGVICLISCKRNIGVEPPKVPIEVQNNLDSLVVLRHNLGLDTFQQNLSQITIFDNVVSKDVPTDFLGLSFGTNMVTNRRYLSQDNTGLITLLKNLGAGSIRIGGNSVDRTFWSKSGIRLKDNSDSLYKEDIVRLSFFLKKAGWKAVIGLNLGQSNIVDVADEATYIYKTLGSSLWGFEVGNEPESYGTYGYRKANYDYPDFLRDYLLFYQKIKLTIPDAKFAGPGSNRPLWAKQFAIDANAKFDMLTNHYYLMGPAGDPSVTMEKLLSPDPLLITQYVQTLRNAANSSLPVRMIEMNSCWKGGQEGISNVHASALWGVDIIFNLAFNQLDGVNFHGGDSLVYSAITTIGGISKARPLYYSMYLFSRAMVKNFTSNQIETVNKNLKAYSFNRIDGKKGVLIINKGVAATSAVLHNRTTIGEIQVHELAGEKLESYDTTTFDGLQVGTTGLFASKAQVNQILNAKKVKITLKAASALLLIF